MRIRFLPFTLAVMLSVVLTTHTYAQTFPNAATKTAGYVQPKISTGPAIQMVGHSTGSSCSTCGSAEPSCGGCAPTTDCNPCDVTCDTGCMVDAGCYPMFCWSDQWFLTGWIDQGVTINSHWPTNPRTNGPLRYTDRANEYQMNQLYLAFGKAVDQQSCRWDIGGRVDVLYGTDYFYTSALGLETKKDSIWGGPASDPTEALLGWNSNNGSRRADTAALYGLAMPQLYGEVQSSFGTNVKLGHFYSPMGHESVMATQNFFYTHSYTMMYGEPTTLTGALVAQRITPCLTGYFGVHAGWDKWENNSGTSSYIAGLKWENWSKTSSLGFLVNTGIDPTSAVDDAVRRNQGYSRAVRTNYSLVFSQAITPNLHYVFQHDLGHESNYRRDGIGNGPYVNGDWLSFIQYLYLQLTPTLSVGCRAEWFRDVNYSRVINLAGIPGVLGDEYTDVSVGLNWKPCSNITVRPEARWDWSNIRGTDANAGFNGIFNNGAKKNQFVTGVDLVVTF